MKSFARATAIRAVAIFSVGTSIVGGLPEAPTK